MRLELARHMGAECHPSWNLEMALTGSASRGLADSESDIELNAWGHELPTTDERAAWLRTLGATDLALAVEVTDDGTTWDRWRYHDVWVETGWQPIPVLETNLQKILDGETIDHALLVLAEVVAHATTLRSTGALHSWQAMLAHYPERLQQRLIDSTIAQWTSPYTVITRWSPVHREQPLTLAEDLVREVQGALRLLFALNQEWEPGWKWIAALSARLTHQPDHLIERIAAIFGEAPAHERMRICTRLILDTLALLPPTPESERARLNLQQGLDAN